MLITRLLRSLSSDREWHYFRLWVVSHNTSCRLECFFLLWRRCLLLFHHHSSRRWNMWVWWFISVWWCLGSVSIVHRVIVLSSWRKLFSERCLKYLLLLFISLVTRIRDRIPSRFYINNFFSLFSCKLHSWGRRVNLLLFKTWTYSNNIRHCCWIVVWLSVRNRLEISWWWSVQGSCWILDWLLLHRNKIMRLLRHLHGLLSLLNFLKILLKR